MGDRRLQRWCFVLFCFWKGGARGWAGLGWLQLTEKAVLIREHNPEARSQPSPISRFVRLNYANGNLAALRHQLWGRTGSEGGGQGGRQVVAGGTLTRPCLPRTPQSQCHLSMSQMRKLRREEARSSCPTPPVMELGSVSFSLEAGEGRG